MNRRNFLKGFAALAAIAVAPKTLATLSRTDLDKLISQMKNARIIENQTFLLYEPAPVTIAGMNGLIIRACTFKWMVPYDGPMIEVVRSTDVVIETCIFEATQRP